MQSGTEEQSQTGFSHCIPFAMVVQHGSALRCASGKLHDDETTLISQALQFLQDPTVDNVATSTRTCTPCRTTSSASAKASSTDLPAATWSSSRWFGTTITVSAASCSHTAMAHCHVRSGVHMVARQDTRCTAAGGAHVHGLSCTSIVHNKSAHAQRSNCLSMPPAFTTCSKINVRRNDYKAVDTSTARNGFTRAEERARAAQQRPSTPPASAACPQT